MGTLCKLEYNGTALKFRVAISTAPNPQGSSRFDIRTHPYTHRQFFSADGEVTVTAGIDSSRCRYCYGISRMGTEGFAS